MKRMSSLCALALCIVLGESFSLPANSQAAAPSSSAASADGSVPVTALDPPAAAINKKLKKNIAYSDLRQLLLADGWKPVVTKKCMANVVGGNFKDLCSKHPGDKQCHVCDELPELNACSGSGDCVMQFSHPDSKFILEPGTYGDIEDTSNLMFSGWDFQKKASH